MSKRSRITCNAGSPDKASRIRLFIKETPRDYPTPSKFTFVGSTGINHETVELTAELIDNSRHDLGLFAHDASEVMLGKLLKSTGKIS